MIGTRKDPDYTEADGNQVSVPVPAFKRKPRVCMSVQRAVQEIFADADLSVRLRSQVPPGRSAPAWVAWAKKALKELESGGRNE